MTTCEPVDGGTLLVLAKSPQAGRVKTRLTPTFSAREAATLAAAAIKDTLAAAQDTRVRTILCWDGPQAPWLPPDLEILPQRGDGLAERLDYAFRDSFRATGDCPTLLVGMDTPHLGPADLTPDWHGADAVLGLSEDGGFWAIGLRRYSPGLFAQVPMSTDRTGAAQLHRLRDQGLSVQLLPTQRDVDTPEDALASARRAPGTRFARTLHRILGTPCDPTQLFDMALDHCAVQIQENSSTHTLAPLDVRAWLDLSGVDELVINRCTGPVIDVGCGPGRFVEALSARGLPALGIDVSPGSVGHTRARGANALCRNVFGPVPGEGRWQTVLLADGNIGIGGDPRALLDRCRALLSPRGAVIVEVDPSEEVDLRTELTLTGPLGRRSHPFPWAVVGATALVKYAGGAGLSTVEEWRVGGRAFVTVRRVA